MIGNYSLAARCRRAANAAIAPKTCNVSARRAPFTVVIQNEPPSALSPAERAAARAAALAVDPRPQRPRPLRALRAALAALTPPQKAAVWTALTTGTPPLWATATGPHAALLAALHLTATASALLPPEAAEARLLTAAVYVLDDPYWLINPPFAPAVNVPGLEPVP